MPAPSGRPGDASPGPGRDVTCGPSQQDGRREMRDPVRPSTACVPVPLRSKTRKRKRTRTPTRRSPRLNRKRETEEDAPEREVKGRRTTGDPRFRFPNVWALKTVSRHRPPAEKKSPEDVDSDSDVISGPSETHRAEEGAASGDSRILGSVMSLYEGCCSALWAGLPERPPGEAPEEDDDEWAGTSEEKRVMCVSLKDTPGR